jgi:hypothetical protein
MSEIITNKLTGKTSAGDVTITSEGGSATMQLQQGVAKAWANFNGTTFGERDSFGISSFSDDGTGDYDLSFINSFANANYSAPCGGFSAGVGLRLVAQVQNNTTSSSSNIKSASTSAFADCSDVCVSYHGDLA